LLLYLWMQQSEDVNSIFNSVNLIDPCFGRFPGSTRLIKVDVCIIEATNQDLANQVDSGKEAAAFGYTGGVDEVRAIC
jgi:hypothetical protein